MRFEEALKKCHAAQPRTSSEPARTRAIILQFLLIIVQYLASQLQRHVYIGTYSQATDRERQVTLTTYQLAMYDLAACTTVCLFFLAPLAPYFIIMCVRNKLNSVFLHFCTFYFPFQLLHYSHSYLFSFQSSPRRFIYTVTLCCNVRLLLSVLPNSLLFCFSHCSQF